MKRWICVLLTTILILSSVTIGGFSASAEEADLAASGAKVALTGKVSYNLSYHNYDDYHATSSYSYLAQNSDGTLTRLERIYNALKDTYEILIETYSSDSGTLKSSKTISCALPIFGGFYAGKNYNFIVFGKDNPSKSDTAEVIRVVRYSKAWAKLSNTSIYGSDTLVPFEAGSLDMTETGGKLYLHTSHKMYNGHQANMNFVIRESDSKLLESNFKVMNIKDTGYISHSFNQFIETDGKDLYRVDHGDSLPRSITIVKTAVSVTYKEVINLSKTGANGLNWTGAMIGGFALTDKNCIIAGTVVNYQNYDTNPDQTENIFVSVTGKDFKTNKVTKLTNYNKNSGVTVYNPHLTKISNAKLLVIWEEYHSSDQRYYTKMATVDGTGALSSAVYSSDCFVSDCEPILCKDGYVRWYAGTAESETLYAINPNSLSAASSSQAQSSDIAAKPIPVTLRVGEEYLLTNIDRAGKISWGYNRTGIVNFDKNTRRITGIATGSVRFYAAAKGRTVYYDVTVAPAVAKINSASVTNSGVSLSWTGVSDASAYKIYIKKSGSSWTGLAVVSGTSFIDHQTTAGASLTYTVRSVDAGGCLFDDYDRLGYTLKYLQTPKITGFENKGGGTVIKWGAVTGASKYALFVKSGSSWKTLATVPGASYTHKISSSGTTNTYTVRCVSSDAATMRSASRTNMSLFQRSRNLRMSSAAPRSPGKRPQAPPNTACM